MFACVDLKHTLLVPLVVYVAPYAIQRLGQARRVHHHLHQSAGLPRLLQARPRPVPLAFRSMSLAWVFGQRFPPASAKFLTESVHVAAFRARV